MDNRLSLDDAEFIHSMLKSEGWKALARLLEQQKQATVDRWAASSSDEESRNLRAQVRAITWLLTEPQRIVEAASEATE